MYGTAHGIVHGMLPSVKAMSTYTYPCMGYIHTDSLSAAGNNTVQVFLRSRAYLTPQRPLTLIGGRKYRGSLPPRLSV